MRFLVTVLDDAGDRHLIVVDDYTERGAKHRAAASFYLDPKGRRPASVTVQRSAPPSSSR
jgi:hypothetical protein